MGQNWGTAHSKLTRICDELPTVCDAALPRNVEDAVSMASELLEYARFEIYRASMKKKYGKDIPLRKDLRGVEALLKKGRDR